MSEINTVHTSCKNCVFAQYDNITQKGCELNYIEKYKNKNIDILEAYDNDKEFYIVNSKKCLGYRENKWFSQYGLEHSSLEEKINKFKELNHIEYLLIIDLKYFSDKDLESLKSQISNCELKPKKIIILRYRDSSECFKYDNIKNLFADHVQCQWRIQTMVDDTISHDDILHNIANLNKGYRFIVDIKTPNNDLNNITLKANKIVHEDLDQIDVVSNKDKSLILFSAPSYRWSLIVEKTNILLDNKNYIFI